MRKSQKTALVAGTVIGMVGGGVAFAYWTSTGAGTGSAKAGTDTPFTVVVQKDTMDKLYPGGGKTTISFTVTNTGEGVQKVESAEATVAKDMGATWDDVMGCDASDFSISDMALTATELAQGESVSGTFKVAMVNKHVSQDACKNVTVPLYVEVS